MRVVAQRVTRARVEVDDVVTGAIEHGLLAYVGAARDDAKSDIDVVAQKLVGLRIFEDDDGKMSRSVLDVGGAILVVSQFTLFGDVRRGRRPSFDDAAPPAEAEALYESLLAALRALDVPIATGRFRADMQVHAVVDGPVTILLDSRKLF